MDGLKKLKDETIRARQELDDLYATCEQQDVEYHQRRQELLAEKAKLEHRLRVLDKTKDILFSDAEVNTLEQAKMIAHETVDEGNEGISQGAFYPPSAGLNGRGSMLSAAQSVIAQHSANNALLASTKSALHNATNIKVK